MEMLEGQELRLLASSDVHLQSRESMQRWKHVSSFSCQEMLRWVVKPKKILMQQPKGKRMDSTAIAILTEVGRTPRVSEQLVQEKRLQARV